ncbi:MAG: polysaccharide biosynthesis C-terminal domain-containing protein [Deltaproteobacteria bacterium]|nr:polysaccharide biosynthesis C-terminal domain-containing protein [Deltaproteobacteria bacterium]
MTALPRRLRSIDLTAAGSKIARHAVQSLLPAVLGVLVSLSVVRRFGPESWGAYVNVVLALQLAAHLTAFGHKELVLRRLARDGAAIGPTVRHNLGVRARVLLPAAILAALGFGLWRGWSPATLLLGAGWIALRTWIVSFEPVVLQTQRFLSAAVADALATALVLGGVWLGADADRAWLLGLACAGEVARLLWLRRVLPETFAATPTDAQQAASAGAELAASLPFFLLGAAGLLGSKVDLYCVSALLPEAEVARFSVLSNMLLWLQSISGLLLMPFIRAVYGMSQVALYRLALGFVGVGVLVGGVGAFGVGLLLERAYHLPIERETLAVGALHVAQMFGQVPAIYALYKAGRERSVLWTSAAIIVLNVPLNLWLIPRFGLLGALLSSAGVGTAAALSYLWRARGLASQSPR